jgi:hypothetical protein
MALSWRPRVVYGPADTELVLAWPQRHWTPVLAHEGGGNKSAIGIRERFTIRDEDLWEVRLRFTEAELPDVFAFLRWARSDSGGFLWYPDREDEGAVYSVDMERPGEREEIRPERDPEYPSLWEVTLTLRRLDEGGFPLSYHGEG